MMKRLVATLLATSILAGSAFAQGAVQNPNLFWSTPSSGTGNLGLRAIVLSDISGLLTFANLGGSATCAQEPALTGDITTSAGSCATTLATVNTNTGSWGSSTAIPNFTVNGKGLITAAGTNAVVAPAGTLSGSTLAAGVTASSLTSVGTLAGLTVTGSLTATGLVTNADLVNSGTTVNGVLCTLGSTCAITATASSITPGTTTIVSGTTKGLLYDNAAVLGNLATANNGVLTTDGSGNPSISSTIPAGVQTAGDTTSATNPTAGNVGEVITNRTANVSLVTGVPKTITSQAISAGHWSCTGSGTTLPAVNTLTQNSAFSLSLTNNVHGTDPGIATVVPGQIAGAQFAINFGPQRYDFVSTTTMYVVATSNFTTSTMSATASLSCARLW